MSNLLKRTLVAVIAAPVILMLPFWGTQYFALFIFVISFLGSKELLSFYKKKDTELNLAITYFTALIPLSVLFYGFETGILSVVILIMILFLIEFFRNKPEPTQIVSGYALSLIYLGIFPASLLAVMQNTEPIIFIYIYSVIMATDIFAYFGGMTCSKMFKTHPLAKKISPKKTIEGSLTGTAVAVLTGFLIFNYTSVGSIPGIDLTRILALSFLISVTGQLGDLFESMLKRDCGMKDSSNIIPGHGGILDRFDSIIFVSPVVYIFFKYLI